VGNDIASKTITLEPFYITVPAPKPAPVAPAAPSGEAPQPAGDTFDRGTDPGAKLRAFTGSRYTAAPQLRDVSQGTRNIHEGQKGKPVEYAQQLLVDAGYGPLEIDGKFGPKTEAAVRAYQKDHGLAVDGKLGIHTLRSLHAGNAASVEKAPGFSELSPDIQAELKSRYQGATQDIRHRQALASVIEDLPALPTELQRKALDAAAVPGSNFKLRDAVSDFVLGLSDAATLSKKLDAIIAK
jgi:peptidoglycan hydrolase-like protein with peptidoglycan-binding domain